MKKLSLLLIIPFVFAFTSKVDKTVKLELTVEEVQLVYNALGKLPAEQVEVLRMKIAMEANKQLSDTTAIKKK